MQATLNKNVNKNIITYLYYVNAPDTLHILHIFRLFDLTICSNSSNILPSLQNAINKTFLILNSVKR